MTIVPHGKATWVGLAARNTLRLEAGFCLHGHEITEEISPLEAGILWAVSMKKCDFVGKDAINNQIKVNEHGKVFHYKVNSRRRIPRDNAEIFFESEKQVKSYLRNCFLADSSSVLLVLHMSTKDLLKKLGNQDGMQL